MGYITGYLLALMVIAVGFLGIILALIVLEVSKPKFAVALVLSLIIVVLGGYYYYVVGQAEKGVVNPNVLNSVLKVSTVAPVPDVILPPGSTEITPSGTGKQGGKTEAIEEQSALPLGVKVKKTGSKKQ